MDIPPFSRSVPSRERSTTMLLLPEEQGKALSSPDPREIFATPGLPSAHFSSRGALITHAQSSRIFLAALRMRAWPTLHRGTYVT